MSESRQSRIARHAGKGWEMGRGYLGNPCLVQKTGSNGRPACKYCGEDITNKRRTSYCSDACSTEYRIRVDPKYARYVVFERDKGVCALCHRDTQALYKDEHAGFGYWRRTRPTPEMTALLLDMGFPRNAAAGEVSLWAADHIVPVVEGGGGCGLENYRTLCLPCHKQETAKLAARLGPVRKEQNRRKREAWDRQRRALDRHMGKPVQEVMEMAS